ncbi:DeoR/GlpR family DNA-binding transcription regulator [Crassaminicella profunda]|uniref:DeoR/GlpR family DNA-binding transcription regulator n=1 Tax=Crassaminicella profunda TaxID=1286698 RepID=UPI001CA77BA0|nr:DeoR/GlpR family DNA-binding transcription regulator [Crassaminicella profunda]QZY55608.1 DeoR/GlpR family DNA-binding transcription regulator [Crassaminicella profunda]
MLKAERRNYIIQYLKEHGRVIVDDLAKELDISPMTIRRDLKYLEDNNFITRTHGGAVLHDMLIEEVPYHQKTSVHMEEKQKIAEHASSLIKEGHTIILDAGTTNMEIAKSIKDMKNLKVITTDLMIALFLSKFQGIQVFCTGGCIQSTTGTCLGSDAKEFIEKIYVDIAFIGTSSVDVEKGLTTPSLEKAKIKKQIIDSADEAILVTDHWKFEKKGFAKICSLDRLDRIITDKGIDQRILEEIKNLGVIVELV